MADPYKPRLAAIVLAAGHSSRLGQPKQLVCFNGVSLVRRVAGLLLDLKISPVVVVTGHRSKEIAAELHGLSLDLIHNDDWQEGMGESIARGAIEIPESTDGVLLALCDQWKLQEADIRSVIGAWKSDISQIMVSRWENEGGFVTGPPVIFPGKLLPDLKCLKGRNGAKAIIDQNKDVVRHRDVPNAAFDLDSPADLATLETIVRSF